MKKLFLVLISLIFISLIFGCTQTEVGAGEEGADSVGVSDNPYSGTCPKGKVDELCTGECGNFIDLDGDGYCDRSQ